MLFKYVFKIVKVYLKHNMAWVNIAHIVACGKTQLSANM